MGVRRNAKRGQLRIIGGQWRGRKLLFTATEGLRPTPDRVRETLFNWLAGATADARCLDLFAGSGALGLEALSRGASHCTFVDAADTSIDNIRQHLDTLACQQAHIFKMDALRWLQQAQDQAFDIVFLDPPFGKGLLGSCCEQLASSGLLTDGAQIYVEAAVHEEEPVMPSAWTLCKDKQAGAVRYRLFVHSG